MNYNGYMKENFTNVHRIQRELNCYLQLQTMFYLILIKLYANLVSISTNRSDSVEDQTPIFLFGRGIMVR